jgi:hypothetical protein
MVKAVLTEFGYAVKHAGGGVEGLQLIRLFEANIVLLDLKMPEMSGLESDPVAKGWLASLARPGGNLTGVWMDFPDIAGKQLQMLKEAVPAVQRVTVVWDDRIGALQFGATQAAASVVDIVARSAPIRHEREADEVVRHALTAKSQAIVMLTSPIVLCAQRRIAELAAPAPPANRQRVLDVPR